MARLASDCLGRRPYMRPPCPFKERSAETLCNVTSSSVQLPRPTHPPFLTPPIPLCSLYFPQERENQDSMFYSGLTQKMHLSLSPVTTIYVVALALALVPCLVSCGPSDGLNLRDISHIPAEALVYMAPVNNVSNALSLEPATFAKRDMLLDSRQLICVDPGYGRCPGTTHCCPSGGLCCDNGDCANPGGTCCRTRGSCSAGRFCCGSGCAPNGNQCCSDGTSCRPGYTCCGNGYCKEDGGECCNGGGSCQAGYRCMIYGGLDVCCPNGDYTTTIVTTGFSIIRPTATTTRTSSSPGRSSPTQDNPDFPDFDPPTISTNSSTSRSSTRTSSPSSTGALPPFGSLSPADQMFGVMPAVLMLPIAAVAGAVVLLIF